MKMPLLFSILFTTDYSQNYSGIIDVCLFLASYRSQNYIGILTSLLENEQCIYMDKTVS